MGKRAAPEVGPTYCIINAMVEGLVLGEETTGAIWWVGELGAMDEVTHGGTPSTSSSSTPRGVPMREVKVPLAVVTVALKDKKNSLSKGFLQFGLADSSDESFLLQTSFLFKVVTSGDTHTLHYLFTVMKHVSEQ